MLKKNLLGKGKTSQLDIETPRYVVSGFSHPGYFYVEENQDRAIIDTEQHLFAVVDGVGSTRGGYAAARLSERLLEISLQSEKDILGRIEEIVTNVHDELCALPSDRAAQTCFGAAALDQDNVLHLAYCGDTEIGIVEQEDWSANVPHRVPGTKNVVYHCVGGHLKVDTGKVQLQSNDTVILATDGVTDNIAMENLVDFSDNLSIPQLVQLVKATAKDLMEETEAHFRSGKSKISSPGKRDNYSCVAMRLK